MFKKLTDSPETWVMPHWNTPHGSSSTCPLPLKKVANWRQNGIASKPGGVTTWVVREATKWSSVEDTWEDWRASLQLLGPRLSRKWLHSHHVFCKMHTDPWGVWVRAVPESPKQGPTRCRKGWQGPSWVPPRRRVRLSTLQWSHACPSASGIPLHWPEARGLGAGWPGFVFWLCLFPLC